MLKFQEWSEWENEVKKMKPWMKDDNEDLNSDGTITPSSKDLSPSSNNDKESIDDRIAFQTPRQDKARKIKLEKEEEKEDKPERYMLKGNHSNKRGQTFLK